MKEERRLPEHKSPIISICADRQERATQTQTHTQTHTRNDPEDRTHFVASGFNPRSTEINNNMRSGGSTHNKGYGLLRRKLEPPRSRARMRAESEDRDLKDSQEQIPKHLNIPRPPGKSYTPTGRSRYVPSVLVSPSHTQTHTQTHTRTT